MMFVLEPDMEVETTATPSRYKVSVYLNDTNFPLSFDVGSPKLADDAVEWCLVDPRVARIEVIDMLDGSTIRTLTI